MAISPDIAVLSKSPSAARRPRLIACYAIAIAVALAIEGMTSATAGAALCAVLVALLLNQHVAASIASAEHAPAPADGIFLVLGLVPLAGLLFVAMATSGLSAAVWPLLPSATVLLAIALSARVLSLPPQALGLALRGLRAQAAVALLGLPLGLLAYGILTPRPLASGATVAVAVAALSALAFTEELLFRGILQPLLFRVYRQTAIGATATLSAAVALGADSLLYGAFAGFVAAGFGLASQRTGSIAGTAAARALMFIGLVIVWPQVLG